MRTFLVVTTVVISSTAAALMAYPNTAAAYEPVHSVCTESSPGYASCSAILRTDIPADPDPYPPTDPAGYGPTDLLSAYNLSAAASSRGAGVTVAIVDAYNDPNAFSDLNIYRTEYGLPSIASCTPASIRSSTRPCFAKTNEYGGSSYPATDGGWAEEESLDIDMVSAICPRCNILLVEANSASFGDLGAAVNESVQLGAHYVSNSYGSDEFYNEAQAQNAYYYHPGTVITASSGDSGFGVGFPASSRYVVAVGGTSLHRSANYRGWTELAWSGAGSGCSGYIGKPSWQPDRGCPARTVADVSAVADPATGVAVYDSTAYQGHVGWLEFGGTSVASPIIASVYGLAGNASSVNFAYSLYTHASWLNDVVQGGNGSCGGSYLCTAGPGYDGPTGLGTPNGIMAF